MNARPAVPILALSAAALLLSDLAPALAQGEPSPNVPVTQRPRPEFDPLGLRAGNFFIFPSVTVSGTYDDNIFATPDDETSDFITVLSPRVTMASNFPRHRLGFGVGADVAFFASEDDENYQDYFVNGDGRLDITRDSALGATANFGRFHETRDDPEDPGRREPALFFRYGGALNYTQAFNRLNFRLSGGAQRTDWESSADRDRDVTVYNAALRTGYFVSPRINTFVEGSFNYEDRDVLGPPPDSFDRDSKGFGAAVGTAVDITAVLFGEVFVGYRRQFYDDDRFEDEDGIAFGADLTWNPTTLTTLTLSGSGDFVPTAVDDAASNFRSSIGVRVDHEVLRNFLIGGRVGYTRDNFDRIDRTDNTIDVGANLTYLINRNFSVGAAYGFTDRSSDLDSEEFTRNRFTVSLTARM